MVRDPKVRTAVRNLRQREDIAKYLRNLDPNSAVYNAKSRTMKDNPNPDQVDSGYQGDNWVKFTGDAPKLMEMEAFMLQANQVNEEQPVNSVGMPSQIELLKVQHSKRNAELKDSKLKELLKKYGGSKHMGVPSDVQNSIVVSDRIEAQPKRQNGLIGIKSKYEED